MNDSPPLWYVVWTVIGQEKAVEAALVRLNFQVYNPVIAVDERMKGKSGIEPLFPGYLFVSILFGRDDIHAIQYLKGSKGLVRFGATLPTALPDGWIEQLRSDEKMLAIAHSFKPGDRVYLVGGVLDQYAGIIEETSGEKRAFLLLDLLDHPIQVNTRDIRLESPP